MSSRRRGGGWASLVVVLAVCAGYYLGGFVALGARFPTTGISTIWPPNAILLAALLLTPPRRWWPILIAVLPPHLHLVATFQPGLDWGAMMMQWAGNVTQAAAAAGVLRATIGARPRLDELRSMAIFIALGAIAVPCAISAVVAYGFVQVGLVESFTSAWRARTLTNVVATLIVTPLILDAARRRLEAFRDAPTRRALELGFLVIAAFVVALPVFGATTIGPGYYPAVLFVPMPLILWATVRFGIGGLCLMLAIVASAALASAINGRGPFTSPSHAGSVMSLQLLLIAIALPLLLLAGRVEEGRRSAAVLQKSQDQYRAIVEDQTELICRFLADGTYTFVNDAYCRCFQSSPEKFLGRTFWGFLPPEGHAGARAFLESITPEHPVATREHEVILSTGELAWQQWTDRGFFDDAGRIIEYQAVGRDITERKRVEQALEKSELHLRRALEAGRMATWELDIATSSITLSEGFDGFLSKIHPDDRKRVVDAPRHANHESPDQQLELRVSGNDGKALWLETRHHLSLDEHGRVKSIIGICTDITIRKLSEDEHRQLEAERRVADALREADRRKDEFLAMLAHELRNPLAPIVMAVDVMRRTDRQEAQTWARDVIGRQAGQLKRLIDDLLDVSRITRGKINLNLEPLDLEPVIQQAVETCEPIIAAKRHELSVSLPAAPLRVRGDRVRLAQVVSNLLNNAAKYTNRGGRIDLSASSENGWVTISVRDNGIGIPPEQLDRVFDLFVQLETARERAQGGLGIGLTLVKSLIELHGGEVRAQCAGPGQGTELIVRLRACVEARVEPPWKEHAVNEPAPSPSAATGRRRVLVVDDNVDAAQSLARVLALHNYEVEVAHDGIEALRMAADAKLDAIFLDIMMPRMDGIQTAKNLRECGPNRGALLVATSGLGRDEDYDRTAAAGFDCHLVKPIEADAILAVLAARFTPAS